MTMQALIRCPNCGSTNLKPLDNHHAECLNCGHKFKLEETKQ